MLIDAQNIKGLIIDINTFGDKNINNLVKKLPSELKRTFIINNQLKGFSRKYNEDFLFTNSLEISKSKVVRQALIKMELNTHEVAYVSEDIHSFESLDSPVGTIFIGNGFDINNSGFLPDFLINKIEEVKNINTPKHIGYMGEWRSIDKEHKSNSRILVFNDSINANETKNIKIISSGRYYEYTKNNHNMHLLSNRIKRMKKFNQDDPYLTNIFKRLVKYINDKHFYVDGIISVPSRPGESNRFFNVCKQLSQHFNIENLNSLVFTIENYRPQQGLGQADRKVNVKDVFKTNFDFSGKNIVLIDDVISTGSTTKEVSKEILNAGANNVIVASLGINQFSSNSFIDTKTIKCSNCDGKIKLKINKSNEPYFECNQKSHTLNYNLGVNYSLNEINNQFMSKSFSPF
ncbi:ComF family protein [Salibacterium halotolerans]|uniref:Phosphoribosyl transferase domain-containing protein n=1 Tax=Salibacterium halotolerans TaxID=1884432 RepID=A0A1I5N5R1_9BACI|nr:phosphoribosyltransferase family protein [Salibacterium halotolerans]SFP17209.1 Phosphoribosyl transferase domain-containing protein [Salibacterium halotolerans]